VVLSSSAPSHLCGENHWLLWQLADSAFPTGGFAHSGGLEAAWQQGEVRDRAELREWFLGSLLQVSRCALPFVNAAHAQPERLEELDRLCDAFTSNHVANRASRAQGRAFLSAAERIYLERRSPTRRVGDKQQEHAASDAGVPRPPFAHLAPVFGMVTRRQDITHHTAVRLYVFTHLRGVIAAAVRLNIVGPMEGQVIQFQLGEQAEAVALAGAELTLDELAQTMPLLDLWQGAQDRLYSRLFQS
jgi:urease accessory protein